MVDLEPTVGSEIKKTRPVVVVSSDAVGKLPIRLIAPITGWKDAFENNLWHIKINPDKTNGLGKASAVDVLQLRGVDTQRFAKRLGMVSASLIVDITSAIAAVIEYE